MPMREHGALHAGFPSYLVQYPSKFRKLCFLLARGAKPPRIPPNHQITFTVSDSDYTDFELKLEKILCISMM